MKVRRIAALIVASQLLVSPISARAEETAEIKAEIYYDSLEYLAMCVQAEAGTQDLLGKAYVTDCIINRFKTGKYDNYYDLINEKNQFSCVADGRINCIPSEDTYMVVAQELSHQMASEIRYFRTGHYHAFAIPAFKYGAHYFSY